MTADATPAGGQPAPERELSTKESIYTQIADYVKERTGKRIGKAGGREIFDLVTEQMFSAATREGSFRFNGGFGSLHVRTYGAGSRRLPSGQQTQFGERRKLRYEEGVSVQTLVKSGGDLGALPQRAAASAPAAAPAPAAASGEALDLD